MSENKQACDLCGLPVEVSGFVLQTTQGLKTFCCDGCQGIYSMLHGDDVLNDGDSTPVN